MRLLKQLYRDESGVIVTAEMVIVSTVGVLALVVGWDAVATLLAQELGDVANAVGALDQSYNYRGLNAFPHARCSGSGYNDNISSVAIDVEGNVDIGGFQLQGQDVVVPIPVPEEPLVEVAEVDVIELSEAEIVVLTEQLVAAGYSQIQAELLVGGLVDGLIAVDELQLAINILATEELTDVELKLLIRSLDSEEVTAEARMRALIQASRAAARDQAQGDSQADDAQAAATQKQCDELKRQIQALQQRLKSLECPPESE